MLNDNGDESVDGNDAATNNVNWMVIVNRKLHYLLDRSSPHVLYRWISYGILLIIYSIRANTIISPQTL